ncbi:MAG: UDP-glucose 4-epimerase GalE [Gemmataceae bacterium]|jgi:UDP-glucose-4-epimerase GalE|nr:UDP-glucose 4-epimerase GalE [Gemmataceae bacterium]
MQVLVTGGAGYIGSHTVKALRAKGHDVWIYDNLVYGHKQAVPQDRLLVGNLAEIDRLDHFFVTHSIDAVIHFAAYASVGESVHNPSKYYLNNVHDTLGLLELLRKHHIHRVVFSSSCAVYGIPPKTPITEDMPKNPINPYGRTKLMIEQALDDYAQAYEWGYASLRYFNAAGASRDGEIGEDHRNEGHLIPLAILAAMGQKPPLQIFGTDYPTPDGTCIRDYIHVEDLALAHVMALEKIEAGTHLNLNLGMGKGYSVREVITTVEAVSGRQVPCVEAARRIGDPAELVADPTQAMQILGWQPRYTDLAEIIQTAWKWHSTHPHGFASQ